MRIVDAYFFVYHRGNSKSALLGTGLLLQTGRSENIMAKLTLQHYFELKNSSRVYYYVR